MSNVPIAAPSASSKRLKKKACRVLENYAEEIIRVAGFHQKENWEIILPKEGHPEDWVRHLARRVIGMALFDVILVSRPFRDHRYSAMSLLVSHKPTGAKLRAFWGAAAGIPPQFIRRKTITKICRKILQEGDGNISLDLLARIRLLMQEEGSSRV